MPGRPAARATLLVNVLWDELEDLRISTLALKDAVGEKLGSGDALTGWDANYEMAKDEWTGILGLVKYDGEQLQRVSDALKEVGTEEVSFEGKGAISVDDGERGPLGRRQGRGEEDQGAGGAARLAERRAGEIRKVSCSLSQA